MILVALFVAAAILAGEVWTAGLWGGSV